MTSTSHVKKTRHRVWRYLFWLLLGALVFAMVLPLLSQQLVHFSTPLLNIQASIDAQKQWLLLFRLTVLGFLVWTWPMLVRRLSKDGEHAQHFLQHWTRKRLAVWLIAIELILVQGWLLALFS